MSDIVALERRDATSLINIERARFQGQEKKCLIIFKKHILSS